MDWVLLRLFGLRCLTVYLVFVVREEYHLVTDLRVVEQFAPNFHRWPINIRILFLDLTDVQRTVERIVISGH